MKPRSLLAGAASAALSLLFLGCPLTERQGGQSFATAPSPPRTEDLADKVARLERAVAELQQPRPQPADPTVMQRLDNLGKGVADLRPQVEDAARRTAKLEDAVERLDRAPRAGTGDKARLDDLEGRLASIEKSLRSVETRLAQVIEAARAPTPPPADRPSSATERRPTPQSLYDEAYGLYKKQGKYEEARQRFKAFLEAYPDASLAANAVFWIGETYFDQKQYEQAILEYDKVVQRYPKSDKVPSALLKQAFAFDAIGDPDDARILLKKILREAPNTDQAVLAKKKLESLGE